MTIAYRTWVGISGLGVWDAGEDACKCSASDSQSPVRNGMLTNALYASPSTRSRHPRPIVTSGRGGVIPSRPRWRMECSQRATNVLGLTLATTLCAISLTAQTQHDPRQSLIAAIQRNDTTTLSRLIATGANPNEKDADGVPALMLATLFADAACVERLLNL